MSDSPSMSSAAHVYKRLVPQPMRSAAASTVPGSVRRKVKRRIARTLSRREARLHLRALSRVRKADFGRSERQVRTPDGRVGHVHTGLTVDLARRLDHDLVTNALDAAEIPWFAVPALDDRRVCIAVEQRDKGAVRRALRALLEEHTGYVVSVSPGNNDTAMIPGSHVRAWKNYGKANVVRITWLRTEPTENHWVGEDQGIEIEFWTVNADLPHERLIGPRPNRVQRAVPRDALGVEIGFNRLCGYSDVDASLEPSITLEGFDIPRLEEIAFPVDVVLEWQHATPWGEELLRAALRSVHQYAPWIDVVHVVAQAPVPQWLHRGEHLTVTPGLLGAEHRLHRLPDLADHFLLLRPGALLGRPVRPFDYFTPHGSTRPRRGPWTAEESFAPGPAPRTPPPVARPATDTRRDRSPTARRSWGGSTRPMPARCRRRTANCTPWCPEPTPWTVSPTTSDTSRGSPTSPVRRPRHCTRHTLTSGTTWNGSSRAGTPSRCTSSASVRRRLSAVTAPKPSSASCAATSPSRARSSARPPTTWTPAREHRQSRGVGRRRVLPHHRPHGTAAPDRAACADTAAHGAQATAPQPAVLRGRGPDGARRRGTAALAAALPRGRAARGAHRGRQADRAGAAHDLAARAARGQSRTGGHPARGRGRRLLRDPGNSDFRSCVAVSEADRGRLRQLLQDVALKEPLYLVACQGDKARGGVAACGSRRARRITRDASVLRVGMLWSDPGSSLTLGLEHGCDIEFWRPQEGRLVAPRPNRVTQDVALDEPRIAVPVSRLTGFAALHTRRTRSVRTIAPCAQPLTEDVRFPIDVVYTWVDGSDPMWQRRRSAYEGGGYHVESANAARYISRDELRYSLRALQQNAPWVRNVYVVTDRQRPGWLNDSHPRITVVDHSEIFDDPSALPTFNSHAIESRLHHIDGLSEHFLYFNDDMFLGCPVTPQTFFLSNGMTRTFLSPSQLPGWELTLGDRPVDAAGKNNRRIILDNFGSAIVQKMRHAPYALRRSVLHEIEREFAEAHWGTSHSRFRSPTDISIPSSLYHYYAYFTGRAVPSEISFAYLDLARPEIQRRLGILLARRDRQAFCINDTLSDGMDVARQTAMLRRFLDAYYPVPSPFEHKEREVR